MSHSVRAALQHCFVAVSDLRIGIVLALAYGAANTRQKEIKQCYTPFVKIIVRQDIRRRVSMKFTDLKKIPTDRGKVWIGLSIVFGMYSGAMLLSPHPKSGLWALVVAAALFLGSLRERTRRAEKPPLPVEKYKLL